MKPFPADVVKLSPHADLSSYSLADAVSLLTPPPVYTLHVSARALPEARRVLFQLGALNKENPFSPFVNLMVDEQLEDYSSWYISCNGHRVGSPGA